MFPAATGYGPHMSTAVFGLVVTIVVMLGIAVFILLFEKRRAREIETDPQRGRQPDDADPPRDGPR